MTGLNTASRVSVLIFALVLGYHVFLGVTTEPWEGDSLVYHLPIAERFLTGEWLVRESFTNRFYYYPGSGEVVLAAMMALKIPLNLFNVFGWVLFAAAVYRLGRKWGLEADLAKILAAAAAMLPSVLRLLSTQTVDIWVGAFWAASLNLLLRPEKKLTYWTRLGFCLGMLVGLKYSGPYFAVLLLIFFGGRLLKYADWGRVAAAGVVAFLFGGIWYIRNWIFTGTPTPLPYETTPVGWFTASEGLPVVWRIIAYHPGGGRLVAESVVSEFLLWGIAALAVPVLRTRLATLGALMFWLYLVMPASAENVLSDLRYIFPALVAIMLAIFDWARKSGRTMMVVLPAIGQMAVVLTQFDYRPKLYAGVLLAAMVWYWKDRSHAEGK